MPAVAKRTHQFFSGLFDTLRGGPGPAFSVLATAVPVSCLQDAGMETAAGTGRFFTWQDAHRLLPGSTSSNNPGTERESIPSSRIFIAVSGFIRTGAEKLGIKNGDGSA